MKAVVGDTAESIWQHNRLQMGADGRLFWPTQWFFVMARPAIIQQDKVVFVCVHAGTSNITVLSSAAPQESRRRRGSRGSVTEGETVSV